LEISFFALGDETEQLGVQPVETICPSIKIRIAGESLLVFTGLWFGIYSSLFLEKYKIISWKKKEFEDLKDLLIFLKDSSYISTIYSLLL
jgi:hypothetical protein